MIHRNGTKTWFFANKKEILWVPSPNDGYFAMTSSPSMSSKYFDAYTYELWLL